MARLSQHVAATLALLILVPCLCMAAAGEVNPAQLDGDWGVYPYLGQDRVLLSDRNTGLYVVDATGVSSQPALYNLHLNPTTVLAGSSSTGTV